MLVMQLRRIVALSALLVLSATGVARADQTTSERIDELKTLVSEASREEAFALSTLQDARNRKAAAEAELAAVQRELAGAQAVLDSAQQRSDEISGRVVALSLAIDEAERSLQRARRDFQNASGDIYKQASYGYATAVDVEDLTESQAAEKYLEAVTDKNQRDIGLYLDRLGGMAEQRAQLETEKEAVTAARAEAEAKRNEVARLKDSQQASRDALATQTAQEQAILRQIQSRKGEYERQLAVLQAESDAIARRLRQRQGGGSTQPSGSGVLSRPVSAPVTSLFGARVHPVFGNVRMHNGIDFGASYGTPIKAAGDGTVVEAGVMSGYGNVVIIDHGNGLATLYAHMSGFGVSSGQRVTRGQTVGYVGATGYVTGPNLHFEVRLSGTPVDPLKYL